MLVALFPALDMAYWYVSQEKLIHTIKQHVVSLALLLKIKTVDRLITSSLVAGRQGFYVLGKVAVNARGFATENRSGHTGEW